MTGAVLVLGDLILDKYIEGHVSRVSPEAPVPVVRVSSESYRIGGSGNVAHNIARQQAGVMLVGSTGGDAYSTVLKNLLNESGVRHHLFSHLPVTTTKIRIIGNHQQIVRIDYEQPYETGADVTGVLHTLLSGGEYAVCVLSDYNKGFCAPGVCRTVIEAAVAGNIRVIVDPKHDDWSVYRNAYLVTPNFGEFCRACGRTVPGEEGAIEVAARELMRLYGIGHILITRSENGMSLVSENTALHLPAHTVDVYDVSGAGDTVVAVIAASLAQDMSLETAVARANIAGSIVVSKFGTYALGLHELEEKINALKK